MKDWLVTLGLAFAALGLFYALFLPQSEAPGARYSQPTTLERGANGYAAAVSWLQTAGVRVVSLRKRYDVLARGEPLLEDTGNLLITTMPHASPALSMEQYLLRNWMESGNTVLVLAALADTPDWSIPHTNRDFAEELRKLTGIAYFVPSDSYIVEPEAVEEGQGDEEAVNDGGGSLLRALDKPKDHRIVPSRRHPWFEGVRTVHAESEFPASEWQASTYEGAFLSIAYDAQTGRDAIWVRHVGKGRLIVSAYASLFANERLKDADNARFLANLAAQTLGPKGTLVFDDHHQGVSELYDGAAFFADRRLHLSIALLLALWFVWALGSSRLRPSLQIARAPRETAFVEAMGGFLARVTEPRQAAARLLQHFFDDLRRRLSLTDGAPPWDWLERQPLVSRSDLQSLRAMHASLQKGRKVNLEQLQNLLVRLQGSL